MSGGNDSYYDEAESRSRSKSERDARLRLDELTAKLTRLVGRAESVGHDARDAALLALAVHLGDDKVTALARRVVQAAHRQANRDEAHDAMLERHGLLPACAAEAARP